MVNENDPHSKREFELSEDISKPLHRRNVLRGVAMGLVALGGASESVLAQSDQDGESDDREFEISYAGNSETVTAFSGTESIRDVYNHGNYTSDIELQKEDKARLFLYDGPNGLTLGTIIDSEDSDTGGSFSYEIDGLDDIEWQVTDDGGGDEFGATPRWSWDNYNTDGGALKLPDPANTDTDGFEITINPRPTKGRDDAFNTEDKNIGPGDWQFVYGEFQDGNFSNIKTIDLTENGGLKKVTIQSKVQSAETEASTPSIDPASVRLSQTAVEAQADPDKGPTLEVTVSNAKDATVRAELGVQSLDEDGTAVISSSGNKYVDPEENFSFDMEKVDSPEVPMLAEKYRPTEDDNQQRYRTTFRKEELPELIKPGDWVPITIVVEGADMKKELTEYKYDLSNVSFGESQLSSYHTADIGYNGDNQYIDIKKKIGFGVFKRVLEGPMAIIRSDDNSFRNLVKRLLDNYGSNEYNRIKTLRLLERAYEHDINRALISNAMTMGGIGVNIRFNDNDGGLYKLDGSIRDDYKRVKGDLFDEAIKKAGDINYDRGEDAFRAVTHFGESPNPPAESDLPNVGGTQFKSGGNNNVYISRFENSIGTGLEEFLHTDGYADLYRDERYPVSGNLKIGGFDSKISGVALFGQGDVFTLTTGTRLADTLGLRNKPRESFSDLLDYKQKSIGKETNWDKYSFEIPKLTEYKLNSSATVLSTGEEGHYPLLIPEFREYGDKNKEGVVLYRVDKVSFFDDLFTDRSFNIILNDNEEPMTIRKRKRDRRYIKPSLEIDYDIFIEFPRGEDGNKLIIRKELPNAGTDSGPLSIGKMTGIPGIEVGDTMSSTEQAASKQVDSETTAVPTPNLRAVDTDGRITGYTDGGEYVRNIPRSRASGDQGGGLEWIEIPQEVDAEFEVVYPSVDGTDTQEVSPEEVSAYCEVAETKYDADAELTVTDDGTTVEGVQKSMHRGTVNPDQTVQVTDLSLPEEESESTESSVSDDQEEVTETRDPDDDESVDINIDSILSVPSAQVGGAIAVAAAAGYILKRRL